jgi:hypothetical protein
MAKEQYCVQAQHIWSYWPFIPVSQQVKNSLFAA